MDLMLAGLNTPTSSAFVRRWLLWQSRTQAAFDLGVRLMRMRKHLARRHTHMDQLIFENLQPLTKLYAAHPPYRLSILHLLTSLIDGDGEGSGRSKSLLSSIGQADMRCFVDVLSSLDGPFSQPSLEVAVWKFLSSAISHRQHWYTLYLLNGKPPRDWFKKNSGEKEASSNGFSMFQIALDRLEHIQTISLERAVGVLDFIAEAIDCSPAAM